LASRLASASRRSRETLTCWPQDESSDDESSEEEEATPAAAAADEDDSSDEDDEEVSEEEDTPAAAPASACCASAALSAQPRRSAADVPPRLSAKRKAETATEPAAKKHKIVDSNSPECATLWIGNVPWSMDAAAFETHFSQFGKLVSARLVTGASSCHRPSRLVASHRTDLIPSCLCCRP
jgi:nucleolin